MAEAVGERDSNGHTVTKAELVEEVTRVTELPRKDAEGVVEAIFDSIIAALQSNDKIEIRGFGSFRTRERRGRTGRNPKTGTKVTVPAKKIPYFKPSKELKDYVNHRAGGSSDSGSRG
jgi:integration host factor subunit beta